MTDRAARLVTELEQIGLSAVDAHRGAFTALAVSKRWPDARIGRYLGVTRARVGQRVDKLQEYAAREDCPLLGSINWAADRKGKNAAPKVPSVAYEQRDWVDIEFAQSLLDIVDNAA